MSRALGLALALSLASPGAAQTAEDQRLKAEMGDPQAQAWMGRFYETGRGVPLDLSVAASWYERSARQGRAGSQAILGTFYYQGRGVPRDFEKAQAWFLACARQGDHFCQREAGFMLQRGLGSAKNQAEGVSWLRRAAAQGDAPAMAALEGPEKPGPASGLAVDPHEAVQQLSRILVSRAIDLHDATPGAGPLTPSTSAPSRAAAPAPPAAARPPAPPRSPLPVWAHLLIGAGIGLTGALLYLLLA